MNRAALLTTLELVRPALADEGLVPIFTNFCFDAGSVHAFKETLTIMAPCEINDTFAVSGKTLISLLSASNSLEVEFTLDKDDVLIKAGKSKMKLPCLPKEEFLFEEPEKEQWSIILDLDSTLLEALKLCLVTSANDATMPAYMGICVKGGDNVYFYSCDGDSMSRYQLDGNSSTRKEVQYIMPTEFCEALLRVAEKTGCEHGFLYVNSEWAIAEFGNNFKVLGRIIDNPEPIDYEAQIEKVYKGNSAFVEIPDELTHALNRARVVADPEGQHTGIKVEGNKMKLNTETHVGNVDDIIPLKGHPDVELEVSAKLMQRSLDVATEFSMNDECTAYRHGEDFLQILMNFNATETED